MRKSLVQIVLAAGLVAVAIPLAPDAYHNLMIAHQKYVVHRAEKTLNRKYPDEVLCVVDAGSVANPKCDVLNTQEYYGGVIERAQSEIAKHRSKCRLKYHL